MMRSLLLSGLVAALVVGLAAEARPAPARSYAHTRLNDLDKDYLKQTAQSNMEEVQFAPVVQSHGQAAAVRRYGARMKRDHARAEAKLQQLARRVSYRLPAHVSEDQQHIMTRLGKLHGTRFDIAYKREMLRDHSEDIDKTRRELSLGRNPQVLASARENLRLLQTHLALARKLPGRPIPLRQR